jgi:hypothetical protein
VDVTPNKAVHVEKILRAALVATVEVIYSVLMVLVFIMAIQMNMKI